MTLNFPDIRYVDGVSVTHSNPRKHVWTFMCGESNRNDRNSLCPCGHVGSSPAPSFVGSDYYCESGHQGKSRPTFEELYTLIVYGMVKIVVVVKLVVAIVLLFLGFISLLVIILLIILR